MKIFLIIICLFAVYRLSAYLTKRRLLNKLHRAKVEGKIGFQQWSELDSYLRNK